MLESSRELTLYIDDDHDQFIIACKKRLLEEVEDIREEEFESFDDMVASMSMTSIWNLILNKHKQRRYACNNVGRLVNCRSYVKE